MSSLWKPLCARCRARESARLQYLVAMAEHRHFGRAADACFVSQPTLSTQLKKLEQRLGVMLDDLNDEQVPLLEDGHCLRDQALEVCNTHKAVENTNFRATSIETLRQMVAADIGIALMPALAATGGGGVNYIPFRGEAIGLCWRTSSPRGALFNALAESVAETLS